MKVIVKFHFFSDLPSIRRSSLSGNVEFDAKDPMLSCRVAVIKWVASFTHTTKKDQFGQVVHSNRYSLIYVLYCI